MRLLFVSGFAPYWGTIPVNVLDLEEGPTVGGGEENLIRCASGVSALGHEVVVYWYGQSGVWRGVEFRSLSDPLYPAIVSEKWDAIASWSGLRALERAQPGVRRLFVQQLNDLTIPGDWTRVDCIVSPSHSHAEQVLKWPIPPPDAGFSGWSWGWWNKRAVVHNGLDPEVYADAPPWESRPFDVGYWNSPDRGLHHLLLAWPLVRKKEPRAKLHVFYEIKRFLEMALAQPMNFYGHRAMLIQKLIVEAQNDPSIIFHGAVPRKKLAKIQKQCRVHCYPYEAFGYCEGFGGSVNQSLAAGCLVLTTPRDAFPSLYKNAPLWLTDSVTDPHFHEYLAEHIVDALKGRVANLDQHIQRGKEIGNAFSWENAAKEMEAACAGTNWF